MSNHPALASLRHPSARGGELFPTSLRPLAFDGSFFSLLFDPALLSGARNARLYARNFRSERLSNQVSKPSDGVRSIQVLTPRALRNDSQDTILINSARQLPHDCVFLVLGKRRRLLYVEHDGDAAADLIYILSAGTAASGSRKV